jgi:lysophospholipase L1-like esterase
MLEARAYTGELIKQIGASVRAMRGRSDAAADAPPPALFPDPLRYYRQNMRLMFSTARTLGVPLAAVLQPTLLRSNSAGRAYRDPLMAETASSWSRIDYWGEKDALYAEARRIFADLQREFDDGRQGLVRDYAPLLDQEQTPSYIDQAHFTPAANAVIAEQLARDLAPLLAAGKDKLIH